MEWRELKEEDLQQIYPHIPQDFAKGEYPDQKHLSLMMRLGYTKGFLFLQDGKECGYAFCQFGMNQKVVLLSLLAVFPDFRNQGIGAQVLSFLRTYFSGWDVLYAEVEKPEYAHDQQERILREHRIGFYERAGFSKNSMEQNYVMWGVPYWIMVMPLQKDLSELDGRTRKDFHDVYDKILGIENRHRMLWE